MKTALQVLAGQPTRGGSTWMGDHWTWFVEWAIGDRVFRRIDGVSVDHWDTINQQRAVIGLPGIDN